VADAAVQLRALSRGETSASILDCLAYGIPVIIHANGSATELPENVACRIQDKFSQAELCEALEQLHKDVTLRESLGLQAREYMQMTHHPARVGAMYHDAIEYFTCNGPDAHYQRLIDSLTKISMPNTEQDLLEVSASIALNRSRRLDRQLFIDISAIAQFDLKTGIQRVVRSVLSHLLTSSPDGYRVEPVYATEGHYFYARKFTSGFIGTPDLVLEDAPIEVNAGDLFLGLDLYTSGTSHNRSVLVDFRSRGVQVIFVVYDLLPVLRPDMFPINSTPDFEEWLHTVSTVSNGLLCISHAVADELAQWVEMTRPPRLSPLKIGFFRLGADIVASAPTLGMEQTAEEILQHVRERPSFLMVSTIEPRKGHAQTLSACEILWEQGYDTNLVIVGKKGWMVDDLIERLGQHPENGKRLFWLENATDELLMKLYDSCTVLLAASEGEGFGLPLIEAAQHGLPIIARDLPVFHEVAGNHAYYFHGVTPEALAGGLRAWLALHDSGDAPASNGIQWLSWAESTRQLLNVILQNNWYREIPRPDHCADDGNIKRAA
jgi:glycosyltransferase involved in cell wall biosynthesis